MALGRSIAVAIELPDEPSLFHRLLQHRIRRGIWPVAVDRYRGAARAGAARSLVRAGNADRRGGPGSGRAVVVNTASRPARASVARVLAMAHVVAVPRGRVLGADLRAGG